MVAVTKDSKAAPQPSVAPTADDLLKRNTDCVYFLASPLTCKKVGFLVVFFLFFGLLRSRAQASIAFGFRFLRVSILGFGSCWGLNLVSVSGDEVD